MFMHALSPSLQIIPILTRFTMHPESSSRRARTNRVADTPGHRLLSLLVLSMLCPLVWADDSSGNPEIVFDIPQQRVDLALTEFAEQADLTLVFPSEAAREKLSNPLIGAYTVEEGVRILLTGTGLNPTFSNRVVLSVATDEQSANGEENMRASKKAGLLAALAGVLAGGVGAQETDRQNEPDSLDRSAALTNIPEILVIGRPLNMDLVRSEDDPQPYVVFDSVTIERSMASNLEDFFQTRLPMISSTRTSAQAAVGTNGNATDIRMRGLQPEQTLILVNGRRLPSLNRLGDAFQADIGGIPLAAVERIEVLPSTAGGIYGGNAVAGVINIILKRDYSGVELTATFQNTFDTNVPTRRLDFSSGFSLENGKTNVRLLASVADSDELLAGDRDFAVRARDLLIRNNPDAFFGASTPPGGATHNIRSRNGEELVLDDGTPLGSNITFVPEGYRGASTDGGLALVQNAGQFNTAFPRGSWGTERSLYSGPNTQSVSLGISREFGRHMEIYYDGIYTSNEAEKQFNSIRSITLAADAPNNPFQQEIRFRFDDFPATVAASDSSTLRNILGAIVDLPGNWRAVVEYNWSRSRYETTSDRSPPIDNDGFRSLLSGLPSSDGRPALNALADTSQYPLDFTPYLLPSPNTFVGPAETLLTEPQIRLSGPLLKLPGGDATLAFSVTDRKEERESLFVQSINPQTRQPTFTYYPERSQDAMSVYMETRLPLVSAANAKPLVNEFDLQLSVRHDRYKTRAPANADARIPLPSRTDPLPDVALGDSRFDSTDMTFGVRYMPNELIAFRASYGTGFLPPNTFQLGAPNERILEIPFLPDPKRGNTPIGTEGEFMFIQGGNPDVKPEESDNWSAGLILTPPSLPGFRLSLDYTRIEKTNELIGVLGSSELVNNEEAFPGRLVRAALTPEDEAMGFTGGVVTAINLSALNILESTVEAYDLQLDYAWKSERWGEFSMFIVGTRQTMLERQAAPLVAPNDLVGFDGGPLELRANAGFAWQYGPATVSWATQHFDSYKLYQPTSDEDDIAGIVLSQGSAEVPSQTYHDVHFSLRLGETRWGRESRLLQDVDIALGIQNVFDRSPPVIAEGLGVSTFADPRLRRYSLVVRAGF